MTRTTVTLVLMIAGPALAAEPPFPATLVTTSHPDAVADRLAELGKRAGIPIDVSAVPKDRKAAGTFTNKPFWEAIRTVANDAGSRVVVEGLGDRMSVVPGPAPPDFVAGPFRFVAKSVTAKFDYDTGRGGTDVAVELHWEPRIRVYRVAKYDVAVQVTESKSSDASKANVAGSRHVLAARFRAVPRTSEALFGIRGSVIITAAEKLLRVTFDEATDKNQTQTVERVGVTLHTFEKFDDTWEAKVTLVYPPGMPEFESFEAESWLRDNAGRLVSPDRTKTFESKDFQVKVTPAGATIVYRFPEDQAKGLRPGKGWRFEVDTPSPLVEFPLTFELKGIRLP
jgi:hypothetical protein